jgi:RHS repeat-associated protein
MRLVNFFLLLLIWGQPALAANFFPKPTIVKIGAPQKKWEEAYQYGFNGQMKVNEWAGLGNHYVYKHREQDPRTGRFISVDPLGSKYPWYSSYQFAGNTPIRAGDLEGLEPSFDIHSRQMETGYLKGTVTKDQLMQFYGDNAKAGAIGGAVLLDAFATGGQASRFIFGVTLAGSFYDNKSSHPEVNAQRDQQLSQNVAWSVFGIGVSKVAGKILGPLAAPVEMEGASNNLPNRLVRVIPEEVAGGPTLGPPGKADVFVTTPGEIEGLNAAGISKKLTLQNSDGSPVKGPFRLIEFDAPKEGVAQPYNRSDPGFKNGGKTAGGATEYVVPNAKVSDLNNVSQTTVK